MQRADAERKLAQEKMKIAQELYASKERRTEAIRNATQSVKEIENMTIPVSTEPQIIFGFDGNSEDNGGNSWGNGSSDSGSSNDNSSYHGKSAFFRQSELIQTSNKKTQEFKIPFANHLDVIQSTNVHEEEDEEEDEEDDEEEECAICLENILTGKVTRLMCGHSYHSACIVSMKQFNKTSSSVCPQCMSATSPQAKPAASTIIPKFDLSDESSDEYYSDEEASFTPGAGGGFNATKKKSNLGTDKSKSHEKKSTQVMAEATKAATKPPVPPASSNALKQQVSSSSSTLGQATSLSLPTAIADLKCINVTSDSLDILMRHGLITYQVRCFLLPNSHFSCRN